MKKILFLLLFAMQLAYSKQLNVVTTYPYIADVVKIIGAEKVQVTALARGDYNPHIIIPKPSFIVKVRNADLLIINGAQLEIGWLPPLIKQANNGNVQPGEKGFLDLSNFVQMIEIPASVSREYGDVHPEGNPHYYLNPANIIKIAHSITNKLCELDMVNEPFYRANLTSFVQNWDRKVAGWKETLSSIKCKKVIEYHKVFDYFLQAFDINLVGTLEPLPGIPPTTKHIGEIEKLIERERIHCLLQDVYNPHDASKYISKKLDLKMIILPHDVGAVKEADGIFQLFDEIVRRLTQ